MVAEAIQGQRDRVMVSTKVSPGNLTRDALHRAAEASLRRLRTDYIDLYQIHWPNPAIPVVETLGALLALID
jgi:aryl-alcohol dehydrogenase-like predicted oxidoreductase